MNELVIQRSDGKSVTTSLIIAQTFEKRHADVLRDIENLHCSRDFSERNFALTFNVKELPNNASRKDPFYEITKDGFSFLAMGYTGVRAATFKELFIKEFNKREALLKDDDYIISRAMSLLSDRLKAIEVKNQLLEACNQDNVKKLQEQEPKVLFADSVAASSKSILIGELAKIITQNGYTIGQNRLFVWLRANGYLGISGERYNIPHQKYIEQGLFELKETAINQPGGTVIVSITTKVTGKGQIYFVNKFLNR